MKKLEMINIRILKTFRFLFLLIGAFLLLYPYSGITGFVIGARPIDLSYTIFLGLVSLVFAFFYHYLIKRKK